MSSKKRILKGENKVSQKTAKKASQAGFTTITKKTLYTESYLQQGGKNPLTGEIMKCIQTKFSEIFKARSLRNMDCLSQILEEIYHISGFNFVKLGSKPLKTDLGKLYTRRCNCYKKPNAESSSKKGRKDRNVNPYNCPAFMTFFQADGSDRIVLRDSKLQHNHVPQSMATVSKKLEKPKLSSEQIDFIELQLSKGKEGLKGEWIYSQNPDLFANYRKVPDALKRINNYRQTKKNPGPKKVKIPKKIFLVKREACSR
jgi:hypothetical protein